MFNRPESTDPQFYFERADKNFLLYKSYSDVEYDSYGVVDDIHNALKLGIKDKLSCYLLLIDFYGLKLDWHSVLKVQANINRKELTESAQIQLFYRIVGCAHFHNRNYAEAEQCFAVFLSQKRVPTDILMQVIKGYAECLRYNKKYDAAINVLSRYFELKPDDLDVYYERAKVFLASKRYAEAVIDFVRIRMLSASFYLYHADLDRAFDNLQQRKLFDHIKTLSEADQLLMFEMCLDKTSLLGKFFSSKTFFSGVGLDEIQATYDALIDAKTVNLLEEEPTVAGNRSTLFGSEPVPVVPHVNPSSSYEPYKQL